MKVLDSFYMDRPSQPNSKTREMLGEQLILLRNVKGWNQQQAADAAGLNVRHIKLLESGGANPELATLEQIAVGYGVTLASLFEPWRMGEKGAEQHILCKKLGVILRNERKAVAIKEVINSMYYKAP